MKAQPIMEIESIVTKLRQSPLFNLSLAAKELFHSNFLAWLCETYPQHVGKFFATFINDPPASYDRVKAYRERNHIDLTLEYENAERLLIENKVKSLPTLRQLREISDNVRKKDRDRTSFLLLTLVHPTFVTGTEQVGAFTAGDSAWLHISYRAIGLFLKALVPAVSELNSYHGTLLKDYVEFIEALDAFQSRFAIDWDDDAGDFFVPDAMKQVRDIRLHDLVDKLRYEQLARRVVDVLRGEAVCVEYGDLSSGKKRQSLHRAFPEAKVLVGSGMWHGVGQAMCYYVVNVVGGPVMLELELQAETLRIGVLMDDKGKAKDSANALWQPSIGKRVWYDFGSVKGGLDEFPRSPKIFNQFSGIFFYRSVKLEATSPKSLVQTIVRFMRLARDNEAVIRQQLEKAL